MHTVCPLPIQLSETYRRLLADWEKRGREGSPPPQPLILGGWAYSNDVEKKRRWEETVAWASGHGLESALRGLGHSDFYRVAELTTYAVGPVGGPMHLPWNHEAKAAPHPEVVNIALASLKRNWSKVAGAELAGATRPLRFSGSKSRRLVVLADPQVNPPWGSWHHLVFSDARRTFTCFRAAINEAVHPHQVDHVDFVHATDG